MKFSVITPTFKRPELLKRTIASVQAQSHTTWEMIVVNDNPGDDTKAIIESFADSRITYLEQPINSGVNSTRNLALTHIATDSDYVVLLDDDDYLTPDALATMSRLVSETECHWLVTALAERSGTLITKAKRGTGSYRYFLDYLLLRRLHGDATHCIKSSYLNGTIATLRFPAIKQGEEWLFFAALGRYTPIHYIDVVTKLTDGYLDTGLNYRRRGVFEQLRLIPVFIKEGYQRELLFQILFWVYLDLRILRAFLK